MSIDQSEERSSISLRFQDDDFGHILPVPAGDTVKVTFYSIDGKHVAWSGDLLCSSQSNENLPPSVSLKDLRAIVKFERGAARVLIPESGTNLGVSLLGLFMTIFYLFVIATKLEARLREGAGAVAAGWDAAREIANAIVGFNTIQANSNLPKPDILIIALIQGLVS